MESDWLTIEIMKAKKEEEAKLNTVYLMMEDRITDWKHDLKFGAGFRFYRFNLQSITDVYFIMQKKINEWKFDRRFGSRSRFYRFNFQTIRIIDAQKKRKEKEEEKNWRFKSMLKDGYTNEKIVKLAYRRKLENIRLTARLKELNITIYEINHKYHSTDLNNPGNLSTVFYKGTEIIY